MNKPSNVYQNTALVTALSVLERALGFLYRVVLARLLGAEGVGVYQIALSHFFMFRTLGGGGLPVTLSRTVSRYNAEGAKRKQGGALLAAIALSLAITLPITFILLPLAQVIPLFSADAGVFKILLVSLSATCAYAVIKGYFWGNKRFLAPAVLEIVEEILTVVLGVCLLLLANGAPPVEGAKRAAIAMSAACILSLVLAVGVLLFSRPKFSSPRPHLKDLFLSSMPITAVRTGGTLINSAVAILLPAMLVRCGMSESEALQAFGVATGMVLPLLCIPMTVIGSLATVLVPELAADAQSGNRLRLRKNIERGIYFSIVVACLLLPIFFAIGKPLGMLTFGNALAGEMLERCCIILLPMSVCTLTGSILNSLGNEKQSFLFSLIGSAIFLVCIFFLPKPLGIYAFPAAMLIELLFCAAAELIFLKGRCPLSATFYKKSALCVLCLLPLGLFGRLCYAFTRQWLGAWGAPIAAALLTLLATSALFLLFKLLPLPSKAKKITKRR